MAHLLDLLRDFLASYGYWAVAATLLLENAGLPLPGETILLLASFSAYSHQLRLAYVIVVAIAAATLGDNIGFAIGHFGGRPLLLRYMKTFRVSHATILRAEHLFARYGAATVFFARFVAGLRIVAGPLAGVLRMHWKRFAIFNFMGASVWVVVISAVGYFFGRHWSAVEHVVGRADILLAVLGVAVLFWVWKRMKSSPS